MALRALPTLYNGVHFRSRMEARWAVFFDQLGLRWEYEPEGFELPSGRWYLPDFWLPDLNGGIYAEIKPTPEGFEPAIEMARAMPCCVLLLDGAPAAKAYRLAGGYPHDSDVCAPVCFNIKYLPGGSHEEERRLYVMPAGQDEVYCHAPLAALAAAKFWRYEVKGSA